MLLALDAILGHKSAHSFATGPVIADPFISPLLLTITPALSSKYINTPSFLRNGFRCRITTAGITVTIYQSCHLSLLKQTEKSRNFIKALAHLSQLSWLITSEAKKHMPKILVEYIEIKGYSHKMVLLIEQICKIFWKL